MRDALCREYPELNWFPERGKPAEQQRAVCRRCPVSDECLGYALGDNHGIWGGTSARERRKLRKDKSAA